MKPITSRDNVAFKRLKALAHSSRERKKSGLALIEGAHLVSAYVDRFGPPALLALSESRRDDAEIAALVARCSAAETILLPDALFAEASTFETPAGILAMVAPTGATEVPRDATACLLLEDIQDPGNLGSLLRSAAAAGVKHVLLSKSCAFAWAPKVLRAGQGAHFSLNIVEGADLLQFVGVYQGQSVALTPHARKGLYSTDLVQPTAFLIGNEGAGLSAELQAAAGQRVKIPMPGKFESLNAAAAGAICLFEMVRQRSKG